MRQINMAPAGTALRFSATGWRDAVIADTVARCQIYNTIEARVEWHPVVVEWQNAAYHESGWRLPCRVDIPFVNTVITFDIIGAVCPDISAVELSIPEETLIERDITLARLLRIDLLPGFGAADSGEEGYLLLPCLCGALHNFKHTVSREERVAIYAQQHQWATRSNYNCVGIHRAGMSWCAIVTAGDYDAEAVVRSHYEEDAKTGIHIGLVYRWEHTDDILPGNRTVRYYLLDPAGDGWAAFARCYRRFLRDERGVRTWAEKGEGHPEVAAFAHSFTMKIFQGCKTPDIHGRGDYQSTTTFAESKLLLAQMQADGIRDITAQMVGWNLEGHDGMYPTRFPVNPVEGGEAEFRDLIAWGKNRGICVTVHDNYQDSYQVSPEFNHDDGIVLRDGTNWRNVPWSGGYNWRMCPLRSKQYAERDFPKMRDMGISGNYYLDALSAFNTCHSPQHPANRRQYIEAFREIITLARNLFGTLSLEVPYGPYYDLMDGVYIDGSAAGWSKFTDFMDKLVDEVVPFLPIALHNSVRYQGHGAAHAAGRSAALHTLAWGAMPFIEVSARSAASGHPMPTYANLADYARESYHLCCVEHADRVTRDITTITQPQPGVYRTDYADGVSLLINATRDPALINEYNLDPESVVRLG